MSGPPSIVFILVDDLGWSNIGCYGSEFYETPNIDRLAAKGVRFTNAYAACPVCSPTRASILSGKYPARVGVTNDIGGEAVGKLLEPEYTWHLPLEATSVASALRESGYRTYHVGKWHLGPEEYFPENHGFDRNIGGCLMGMPHTYFSPWKISTLPDAEDGDYLTDRLTDEAIDLIRNNGTAPFFLNLWYYSVHVPIQAKEAKIAKYRKKRTEMGLDERTEFADGGRYPAYTDWRSKDARFSRRLLQSDPVYAAMIESLDENVGRLLDELDRRGPADETVVIFTSDNGGLSSGGRPPTCNRPLSEGKGWIYEGGVREPLLVRWPGVTTPGELTDRYVTSPDFYPTMLEMAGVPAREEQHVDGMSFAPLIEGRPFDRGPVYWHYPHYGNQGGTPACSVRSGNWKLIRFLEDEHYELYNLREDIGEEHNRMEENASIAADLKTVLNEWLIEVGARLPKRNPDHARTSCA